MPLPTDLPTSRSDGDGGHTAGHNTTNTRVNEVATAVNLLPTTASVTSAVATHSGAADPHGDRAYAAGLVAALSLADLDDVDPTTPTDGQALVWDDDTDTWGPGTISSGGGGGAVDSVNGRTGVVTGLSEASDLTAHAADTTAVHGIADTSVLATATSVASAVSTHAAASDPHGDRAAATAALAAHEADTTSVHGIADTSALATASSVASAIATHAAAADPHGDRAYTDTQIAGRQPLDGDLTAVAALDSAQSGMLATDGAGWTRKTYPQVRTALSLAAVATSGAYSDLSGTPTLGNELYWNGSDYVPTALKAATDRPRTFKGPTDPATVTGVVLSSSDYADTWIEVA